MKRTTLFMLLSTILLNVSCQNNNFLLHFPTIETDSIFSTTEGQKIYYSVSKKDILPDSTSLKYIFNNDKGKMHGTEEGYNMDTDEYFTTTYVKKAKPIFKKKTDSYYLLCYGLESILYLGIYDPELDKITHNIIISDFSDEMGNVVTHSVIFPSNYIAKTKIEDKITYELIRINYKAPEFTQLKTIEVNDNKESQKNIFEKAFSILEITNTGELIK